MKRIANIKRKTKRFDRVQYRAKIEELGLSQVAAARLLGVDQRTSRRWALGEATIHPTVGRFLRYLLATGKTGDKALRVLEPMND